MYVASVVWTLYMLYVLLWCGHCIRVVYSICRVDTILGVCSTVVWTLHLMYAVLWCGHYTWCMQYCGVDTVYLLCIVSAVWTNCILAEMQSTFWIWNVDKKKTVASSVFSSPSADLFSVIHFDGSSFTLELQLQLVIAAPDQSTQKVRDFDLIRQYETWASD